MPPVAVAVAVVTVYHIYMKYWKSNYELIAINFQSAGMNTVEYQ